MPNLGTEQTITVIGKTYTFSPFTIEMLHDFVDWANGKLEDPLSIVAKNFNSYPKPMQELLVAKALEKAASRKEFSSPEIQTILNSVEGGIKICCLLLRKHHPALTEKEVSQIIEDCINEHGSGYIERVFAKAQGTIPQEESDVEREALQDLGLVPVLKKKKAVK
jgi:hypothetical protein